MLWLALHFRLLPLEVFTRGAEQTQPLAIAAAPGNQAELIAVNAHASGLGVHCGMTASAACALAAGLHIIPRDGTRELATLKRIAAWGMQFTSLASIAEPSAVLLEIEGSLKLFNGLSPLYRRIRDGLKQLGLDSVMACAPTPLAAQLFARAGLAARIQHRDALRHALGKLPVSLLEAHDPAQLQRYGIHTIAECLQLPRDGLTRRAGQALLDDLDRALGLTPDPRVPYTPPRTHHATLPLPAPAASTEALLFAARRLLAELCGWLTAIGCGVQCPRFVFTHEKQLVTEVTLELSSASRELDHLATLLRERLARVALPSAVIEIALHSGRITPLASRNTSFLPDNPSAADSALRLIERLRARLGADALQGVMPWPDHRPEHAWRACQPGARYADVQPISTARPLWLIVPPKPLREINARPHDGGPLSLLAGPERIEAGWWDGRYAARDYFIARNEAHALLWIFRERGVDARWFLHGVFA